MGKRELLIIIIFVAVGVVAYELTAPPPKPGERRFSISQIFSGIRREISSNASSAKVSRTGTVAVPATVTELRVWTARSVPLTIQGEDRDDVAYDMPVESTGPDEATAREWANKSKLIADDLGVALALTTFFPEEGTQHATLTLRVPARLAIRVENSGRIDVSKVGALELRNLSGETTISNVEGPVTGSHRSGDVTVTGAASVNLTLSSSRAKIRGIAGELEVSARSGECLIAESAGPISVVGTNLELVITASQSPVKVTGEGGQVKVLDAHSLSIDVRRMQVDIEAAPGAKDQLTVITTDEPLRLSIGGSPSMHIDAVTTNGGSIRAADFDLAAVTEGRESRLNANVGKGDARLVLRNSRGDIVISKRK